MFALYMFCFAESEMRILASFERYMDSYVVSEFLILLMAAVKMAEEKRPGTVNWKNLAVLFAVCAMIFNPATLSNLSPQIMKGRPMGRYYDCAAQILQKTEENSTVYILAAEGMPQNEYFIKYYADGREIDLSRAYDAADFTDENYVKNVIETIGENDYVFVMSISREMETALGDLTGGSGIRENCVYRTGYADGKLILSEAEAR